MADAARLLLAVFLADILPIFAIAGVGFLLARHFDVSVTSLSRITFNALVPCLVFDQLVRSSLSGTDLGRMVLFPVLVIAAAGAAAAAATAPLGLERPLRAAFLLVVMLSNSGNYGLPLTEFAFGSDALTFASVYFVTSSMMTYTVGVFVAAAGRRSLAHAARGVLRVPTIYAVAAAVALRTLGVALPAAAHRTVGLLADAALPLMILVLGMQLERVRRIQRPCLVTLAAALSLLVTPSLAFALAALVGLSGPAFQAGMLQAAMPAAVVTTILALEFDLAPDFVTSVVFVSTLASPLTLTVLIAYLQTRA